MIEPVDLVVGDMVDNIGDASAGLLVWSQLLVLGTIVNVTFSNADVLCVLLADRVVNRIAQRVGDGLLAGLGLKLATNRQ